MAQSTRKARYIAPQNTTIEYDVIDYPENQQQVVRRIDSRTRQVEIVQTYTYRTPRDKANTTKYAKSMAANRADQEPEV